MRIHDYVSSIEISSFLDGNSSGIHFSELPGGLRGSAARQSDIAPATLAPEHLERG